MIFDIWQKVRLFPTSSSRQMYDNFLAPTYLSDVAVRQEFTRLMQASLESKGIFKHTGLDQESF